MILPRLPSRTVLSRMTPPTVLMSLPYPQQAKPSPLSPSRTAVQVGPIKNDPRRRSGKPSSDHIKHSLHPRHLPRLPSMTVLSRMTPTYSPEKPPPCRRTENPAHPIPAPVMLILPPPQSYPVCIHHRHAQSTTTPVLLET